MSDTKLNDGLEAILDHLRTKACEHIDAVIKETTGHLAGVDSIGQTRAVLAHLDSALKGAEMLRSVFTVGPENLWKSYVNQLADELLPKPRKSPKPEIDKGSLEVLKEIYQLTMPDDHGTPAPGAIQQIREIAKNQIDYLKAL